MNERIHYFTPSKAMATSLGMIARRAFSDTFAHLYDPAPFALTTISQPLREMGTNAIRAMLSRLADPTLPPITMLSNPQLVVRASCGAFMQRGT